MKHARINATARRRALSSARQSGPLPAAKPAAFGLAALLLWAAAVAVEAQPRIIDRLDASRPITYHIAEGESGSDYRESDAELALWALEAWNDATGGALELVPAPADEAILRIHFVPASAGQYGEMRPTFADGRRGAEVYVRPDVRALGPAIARAALDDALLRETIVYLTCLHELGHALGLEHTANEADIMYFFGYGGDVPAFFGRYRDRLESRDDIRNVSGLSADDVRRIAALYADAASDKSD